MPNAYVLFDAGKPGFVTDAKGQPVVTKELDKAPTKADMPSHAPGHCYWIQLTDEDDTTRHATFNPKLHVRGVPKIVQRTSGQCVRVFPILDKRK